ncbi:Protein of unknown function [Gryllus bimaculatus]|nr:Protein of unknown function [Gryllus bimaculatus]
MEFRENLSQGACKLSADGAARRGVVARGGAGRSGAQGRCARAGAEEWSNRGARRATKPPANAATAASHSNSVMQPPSAARTLVAAAAAFAALLATGGPAPVAAFGLDDAGDVLQLGREIIKSVFSAWKIVDETSGSDGESPSLFHKNERRLLGRIVQVRNAPR